MTYSKIQEGGKAPDSTFPNPPPPPRIARRPNRRIGDAYYVWDGVMFVNLKTPKPNHIAADGTEGVYMIVKNIDGECYPIIIGQSENMGKSLNEHLKDENIRPHADEFHIHRDSRKFARDVLEKSQIEIQNPPRNGKYRTGPAPSIFHGKIPDLWNE